MQLRLGFLYFVLVFAAGFVLGTVRILILVPRLGVRTSELLETPLMIAVTVIVARWIVRRFRVPSVASTRLAIGLAGLLFLLIAEFGIAARLQGQSITEAVMNRDPVSGPVYFISLGLFALMPALVGRFWDSP
jgi:hypothetical protein